MIHSLPESSNCVHWLFTFLPVNVDATISSLVNNTSVISAPRYIGCVIRRLISRVRSLTSVAAETWCWPFKSASGGLDGKLCKASSLSNVPLKDLSLKCLKKGLEIPSNCRYKAGLAHQMKLLNRSTSSIITVMIESMGVMGEWMGECCAVW